VSGSCFIPQLDFQIDHAPPSPQVSVAIQAQPVYTALLLQISLLDGEERASSWLREMANTLVQVYIGNCQNHLAHLGYGEDPRVALLRLELTSRLPCYLDITFRPRLGRLEVSFRGLGDHECQKLQYPIPGQSSE
jgi:hypothetical protein